MNRAATGPSGDRRFALFDLVVLGYLAILTTVVLGAASSVEGWWLFALAHAIVAVAVVLLAKGASPTPRGWLAVCRYWYPLMLVPLLFRELEWLVHPIRPLDFDRELSALDLALFGDHPAVRLEALATPWLTELMQVAYLAFYLLPVTVGVALYRRRRLAEYEIAVAAILLAFFTSYLGFFVVPALGPRFHLAGELAPLPSLAFSAAVRDGLNLLEGVQRDAFPSGHVAVAIASLLLAARYRRPLAPWLVPVVALTTAAAVYLRYHYVVDLVAGAFLGAGCTGLAMALGPRLHRPNPRGRESTGGAGLR